MAFLRYADVPGMIGKIGTKMGEFGINIGQMGVGREVKEAKAVMGITLDERISSAQLAELVESCGLYDGKRVELGFTSSSRRSAGRSRHRTSPPERT